MDTTQTPKRWLGKVHGHHWWICRVECTRTQREGGATKTDTKFSQNVWFQGLHVQGMIGNYIWKKCTLAVEKLKRSYILKKDLFWMQFGLKCTVLLVLLGGGYMEVIKLISNIERINVTWGALDFDMGGGCSAENRG